MTGGTKNLTTALSVPGQDVAPLSPDIIREIAMDIGKEAAFHIETMYPDAVKATSETMLLSLRNCIFNQIMAALGVIDEDEIRQRIKRRKAWRTAQRKWRKS